MIPMTFRQSKSDDQLKAPSFASKQQYLWLCQNWCLLPRENEILKLTKSYKIRYKVKTDTKENSRPFIL